MIEIKMSGLCEDCRVADLFLDCTEFQSYDMGMSYTSKEWETEEHGKNGWRVNMTGKKKRMIRSHRSLRAYKPTNKAILNREASKRRQISRTVRGAMAAGLQEGGTIENYRSGRRGLFGWIAVWLDMLRGFIRQCLR